uniref:Uncharacterized protein n=1 Tax=Arundo donax TaxID=35708 RepID=A0A0A8ZB81_ARUDO
MICYGSLLIIYLEKNVLSETQNHWWVILGINCDVFQLSV